MKRTSVQNWLNHHIAGIDHRSMDFDSDSDPMGEPAVGGGTTATQTKRGGQNKKAGLDNSERDVARGIISSVFSFPFVLQHFVCGTSSRASLGVVRRLMA